MFSEDYNLKTLILVYSLLFIGVFVTVTYVTHQLNQ